MPSISQPVRVRLCVSVADKKRGIMFKQAIESVMAFLYFILLYTFILLAYIFAKSALGSWFKKKANALMPEMGGVHLGPIPVNE